MCCVIVRLTFSPRIKGLGRLSFEEVLGSAVSACANEIRFKGLGGGGATVDDDRTGAGGASSSACQSKGMAAAVWETSKLERMNETRNTKMVDSNWVATEDSMSGINNCN